MLILNRRKAIFRISSLLGVCVIAVIWFQLSSKTTFGKILGQSSSEKDEIEYIVIQANIDIIDTSLWTRIDDPKLIDQLITGQSDISLKKQLTKSTRILNHTMTLHTQFNSYFYDFDEDYFVGEGRDYKIANGSFIDIIRSLRNDVEWKTREEFFDAE